MSRFLTSVRDLVREKNFLKLFTAVFFSEIGGYLTNTVILFYVNEATEGSRFYLGLAQVMFVAPLMLGTLVGGTLGERANKRRVMMLCELMNFVLIAGMLMVDAVMTVILIRALVVFFAGLYNPNRMAIMQELVAPAQVRSMTGSFTAIYALLHSVGPWLGASAWKAFGGIEEVLAINLVTYLVGLVFIWSLDYRPQAVAAPSASGGASWIPGASGTGSLLKAGFLTGPVQIVRDIREGMGYVASRSDLSALLQSVSVGGICLGVFFPTLLPFIRETFAGDETTYGQLMAAFGVGGVLGGISSPLLLRHFPKGRVLVLLSIFQALVLLAWTQISSLNLSLAVLVVWGGGLMCLISTYINYVQVNVSSSYRTRAFSIYDQSISANVIIGAVIVTIVGDRLSPSDLLALTALAASSALVLRYFFSESTKALYAMET